MLNFHPNERKSLDQILEIIEKHEGFTFCKVIKQNEILFNICDRLDSN